MKPGLYAIGRSEYETIDAANFSVLKYISESPAHCHHAINFPQKPTDSLNFGSAVHLAILEPERLSKEYAVPPDVDRRTKEGKADWARFEAENPGRSYLKADEWLTLEGITNAIKRSETAQILLSGDPLARNEVSVLWRDGETDSDCKARMDRFTTVYGQSVVVDLKTCESAGWGFKRSCEKYYYYAQAAMYLDGLAAISPRTRRFVHLAVEKSPPFAIKAHELDEESIQAGRSRYRKWLTQYVECKSSGKWPGYAEGIHPLRLSEWALKGESE